MNDQQLIRAMVQRLTPGQAASLRDQAREELAKLSRPVSGLKMITVQDSASQRRMRLR